MNKQKFLRTHAVYTLLLSACIPMIHGSACTSSANTFFNANPTSIPHTTTPIKHKKHLQNKIARAGLVNVKTINPNILVDLRYAGSNNFTGKKIYRTNVCYLKKTTALKLAAVQKELEKKGLGLKIWDGYRSPATQKNFWRLVPDPRYVAPPAQGSRHTRGCSVDVTLVTSAGNELPMPTDFDDFSEKAHQNFMQLPAATINNRELLTQVMKKNGFIPATYEWWHFDDSDWKSYPLLNVNI